MLMKKCSKMIKMLKSKTLLLDGKNPLKKDGKVQMREPRAILLLVAAVARAAATFS